MYQRKSVMKENDNEMAKMKENEKRRGGENENVNKASWRQ